jgi:N-acetylmuramoyl-L-alanine amidase
MGLCILDRQHVGDPNNLKNTGASGDLDQNGRVDIAEREGMLTALYGLALEQRLRELGHDVILIADGRYSERHARANAYAKGYPGKVAYLALHLNAGGGAYGCFLHDHRSTGGKRLANIAAQWIRGALPELAQVHAFGAAPGEPWGRAFSTISGVYEGRAVGLCVEPCFLDGPHAASLLSSSGLRRIGSALADAVHSYLSE